MGSLTDTKTAKKQPATATQAAINQFEKSLLALEDICMEIKDGEFTHGKEDTDRIVWQQKLKNIVTPLSLALSEYKGPRVFHQHYAHDKNDELVPVMESALDNLMQTCIRALDLCENLNGMKGSLLLEVRAKLHKALQNAIIHSPVD